MLASIPSSRSIALTDRSQSIVPRLLDRVVGDVLELMVYSIESLRERIGKIAR